MSGLEKKFATKSKIVNYIINRESTSKVEISKELNLSMPTVLSNVKDLLEKGIIIENGEYESTGGRKAKSIGNQSILSLCNGNCDYCKSSGNGAGKSEV